MYQSIYKKEKNHLRLQLFMYTINMRYSRIYLYFIYVYVNKKTMLLYVQWTFGIDNINMILDFDSLELQFPLLPSGKFLSKLPNRFLSLKYHPLFEYLIHESVVVREDFLGLYIYLIHKRQICISYFINFLQSVCLKSYQVL